MKGVVFTEFYDFVETRHSPLMLQEIINQANLGSDGSYTATGTYPDLWPRPKGGAWMTFVFDCLDD